MAEPRLWIAPDVLNDDLFARCPKALFVWSIFIFSTLGTNECRVLRTSINTFRGRHGQENRGFAGAVSSLALMHGADAAPAQSVADIANPRSYAELLQPIPNAAALLKEVDAADAAHARARNSNVQLAQFWGGWGGGYQYHHPPPSSSSPLLRHTAVRLLSPLPPSSPPLLLLSELLLPLLLSLLRRSG